MPQLTIPAATYEKLALRAAELNVTVEQLVAPALDLLAGVEVENGHPPVAPPDDLAYDQWKAQFDEFLATVQSRTCRYPAGFQADVSR
jgi:hypothetical protein